ncbi:MAG: addiction module protein [Planctomycetota bacterium]
MTDAQSIVTAATQLPEQERVQIVEALLDSFDASPVDDPAEVADAWRREVHRRSQELRDGLATSKSWLDVRAEGERLLDGGS